MNKKVIFFSPYYYPESFPHNGLIEELVNRNNSITVITALPNYRNYGFYKGFNFFGPYNQCKSNLNIFRLPIIPRFNDKFYSIFLFYLSFFLSSFIFLLYFSFLNRKRYDYFITFCGSPVYSGVLGNLFSKILKTKHLLWVQDIWPEAIQSTQKKSLKYTKSLINSIQSWMWNSADVLVAQSDELNNFLIKNSKASNHFVLFNPVRDLSKNEVSNSIITQKDYKSLYLTYMGAIGSGKYIEEIIEAVQSIDQINVELNLCGTGSEYKNFKKKYNHKNIIWHGWLEKYELDKISDKTDFFIFGLDTRDRQSLILPSKLQTYCMYGRPIICCADGASKALIDNNNFGITCNKKDKYGLIDAITNASKISEEDRVIMGRNAKHYFKNNFTKEKVADQLEENLKKINNY